MNCAQAGALASGTRMEFEQGTNYANVLPNDALSEVLGRAMQKAGGYEFTPEERQFAEDLQKTLGAPVHRPGPEKVQVDKSEGFGPASTDAGDVSWVVPTGAIYRCDVRARRGRAHLAGRGVRRIEHRAKRNGGGGADAGARQPSSYSKIRPKCKPPRQAFQERLAGRNWTTRITADSKPPLDYAVK